MLNKPSVAPIAICPPPPGSSNAYLPHPHARGGGTGGGVALWCVPTVAWQVFYPRFSQIFKEKKIEKLE